MLHIKTDYLSNNKEFIFETNTQVANNYKDNDAELLRNWYEHQDNLNEILLEECAIKVKEIVSTYINEQAQKNKDKINKDLLDEALSIFNSLKQDDWSEFVKLIKWRFASVDSDIEFSSTIESIESLILQLPSPIEISKDNRTIIFGVLYKEVSLKSSEENPENRNLSRENLELLLLALGTEKDKWYAKVYEEWREINEINVFHIGEFFEILDASRYCRWNNSLNLHDGQWINLLSFFIFKISIHKKFQPLAIYEYLWLKYRPDYNHYKEPIGDLLGCEDLVRTYLKDFEAFENAKELEDAHNVLTIAFTAKMADKVNLNHREIIYWFRSLYRTINQRIKTTVNPNEKCHYLEELGTFLLFASQFRQRTIDEVLSPFNEILTIIDQAHLYHAAQLSDRVNKYIKMFISINPERNKEIIQALESFSEKLDVHVQKRDGKYNTAKKQVERGISYLQSNDPSLILKALSYFHNAKDLYHQEETIEGNVLALINIAQLYNSVGMNFAAKYYAMGAAWVSLQTKPKDLLQRNIQTLALTFYADFKQGAWLSAIVDFFYT
ncbi:hypothetical protein Barb7_01419 [Bacteroidales bacterium Barb7]|nr:hypothetical protein Barb7_01419 [Bacteroidales bacterium Barb7]